MDKINLKQEMSLLNFCVKFSNVDFELNGVIHALMGANGAGKSH